MKNKYLFGVAFIFGILLIGMASAANWDNKLTYSKGDMVVDFKNSFLGVIPTSDIGSIELKSHGSVSEIRKLGAGDNQAVMFYDFNGWNTYKDGLGEVTFTNMKTGEEIGKDYYFAERVFEQKLKYKIKCTDKQNANGTYSEECSQVQNGFKEVEVWKRLNSNDIPNRNIRIGLITNVEVGDYLDAVWTIAGKKVSKHATWTASLNVGLVIGYTFENNNTLVDVMNNQNGTIIGTPVDTGQQGGIIGFAWEFVGLMTDSRGEIDLEGLVDTSGTYTYSFWASPHINATNNDMIVLDTKTGRKLIWINGVSISGNFGLFDGGARDTGVTAEADVLHHYVLTDNATGYFLYVDSILTGSTTLRTEVNFGGDVHIGSTTLTHGDNRYIGILDEFYMWNRSISQAEVDQLYNGCIGITFIGVFTPTVTLNSPADNFNTTNPTVTFNGTISITVPLNVSLIINDVYNETNSTGILGDYIFTKTLDEGTHTWNLESCNADGCTNGTARTFTVDTTPPTINLESPTEIFSYLVQDLNASLNFTPTDFFSLDACLWEYNNTNTTISCNNATKTVTGFSYEIGFNNGTIYANDTLNNLNSSFISWDVKVTETAIEFNTGTNQTQAETFSISVDANSSLSTVNFYYGGTKKTTTNNSGNHTVTFDVSATSTGAQSLIWEFDYGGSKFNSTESSQTIDAIQFGLCNGTLTTKFLNFTFKDEGNLSTLNASIPTANFFYFLGTGIENKSFTYINTTENIEYDFCFSPPEKKVNLVYSLQYKGTSYPQRIF